MQLDTIQNLYHYLHSHQTARHYLQGCYEKLPNIDAEAKSYENCTPFMHELAHAHEFYQQAQTTKPLIQPILLFYGMVHLLKAVLLTRRPFYPETTAMLAHGVSARKRKKKSYTFLQDEVRPQLHGLFPYIAEHLFSMRQLSFEKISMQRLLRLVPELAPLFHLEGKKSMVAVGNTRESRTLSFPLQLLDTYHLTANAFIQRIQMHLPATASIDQTSSDLKLHLTEPLVEEQGAFFIHQDGRIFFPVERDDYLPISEVLIHYLLLYNLSMLSRYEAEWWGELVNTKTDLEYPLIIQFMNTTAKKMPLLLGKMLWERHIAI